MLFLPVVEIVGVFVHAIPKCQFFLLAGMFLVGVVRVTKGCCRETNSSMNSPHKRCVRREQLVWKKRRRLGNVISRETTA